MRRTNLPRPETQVWLCGLRVDFFWPDLGLVVEADGLRYHRTEAQQRSDRQRDRTLAAEGMVVLRFTHVEVFHQPERVGEELERLAAQRTNSSAPRRAS